MILVSCYPFGISLCIVQLDWESMHIFESHLTKGAFPKPSFSFRLPDGVENYFTQDWQGVLSK